MKKYIVSLIALILTASIAAATTNEITVYLSVDVTKNSLSLSKNSGNQVIQMLGTRYYSSVYALTTTNQPMAKGAVGNLGWCYGRNLSTNATVSVSFDAGVSTNLQLLPSEAMLFRLAPGFQVTNIQAAVVSGAGDYEFVIIEK